MKFGLDFDDSLRAHPKVADWKELPPLKAPKKPKGQKPENEKKAKAEKKKCAVM